MRISRIQTLVVVLAFGVALEGALGQDTIGLAQASGSQPANTVNMRPQAGPNRPANVPDGYLITPFGYFHPSCVQSLAKGERVLADGRLQHADGTAAERAAVCSYPHYTRDGISSGAGSAAATAPDKKNAGAGTSPEIDGWLENANTTTGSPNISYGALIATWRVPPAPRANDGQVLYFFPGFEDIDDQQTSILQPVLEWYYGWSIASWNCCLNGIVTNSPGVGVRSGDEIYGSITSTCPAGTLSCATWNVLTLDLSTGQSTTLGSTPSQGQVFNWAFGGVLEPYYVIACDDYPPDRRLSFTDLTIFDQDLNPIFRPQWSTAFNTTATPQCHYDVKATVRTVTLDY